VITRGQIRDAVIDGGRVVDSAGHSVGSIEHVHLSVRTFEPAHVTVACLGCDEVVVVPLVGARVLDGCVHMPYVATDVCGIPRADGSAGRLHPGPAAELDGDNAHSDDGVPAARAVLATGARS
jgi:hypothetical protein